MGLCFGVCFVPLLLDSPLTVYRHLQYTIPPAVLLTLVLTPLLTRVDTYKTLFLITVSVSL